MNPHRLFAGAVVVVGLLGVVLAFLVLGTPKHERQIALDEQRSADLLATASSIHDRYVKAPLPSQLPANVVRRDPATRKTYAYQRLDSRRYRLCATFDAASDPDTDDGTSAGRHRAGTNCYQFDARANADVLPAPVK